MRRSILLFGSLIICIFSSLVFREKHLPNCDDIKITKDVLSELIRLYEGNDKNNWLTVSATFELVDKKFASNCPEHENDQPVSTNLRTVNNLPKPIVINLPGSSGGCSKCRTVDNLILAMDNGDISVDEVNDLIKFKKLEHESQPERFPLELSEVSFDSKLFQELSTWEKIKSFDVSGPLESEDVFNIEDRKMLREYLFQDNKKVNIIFGTETPIDRENIELERIKVKVPVYNNR